MRSRKTLRAAAAALLLLASVAAPAGGREAAAGGKFAADGFSVSFPAQPEKSSRRREIGPFPLRMSTYSVAHEGMGYFVSWVGEMPAASMREPSVEENFYFQLADNVLVAAKRTGRSARYMGSAHVSLGGFTGRQYVFSFANEMGVLRAYKVGLRFYVVGVFGDKRLYDAQRAVSFLESFSLTPNR
jgi:hypothetical protein